MPAGTELITWSPRVGAAGDDRYDPGPDILIASGNSSGYSATPTIAEINARSGLNQIIAEIKRRTFSTTGNPNYRVAATVPAVVYTTLGNKILGTDFAQLKTAIDQIRTNELQSAYSFRSSVFTNLKSLRQDILDFRKALAIDYIALFQVKADSGGGDGSVLKYGFAYPPATFDTSLYFWVGQTGKANMNPPYDYSQARNYLSFIMPVDLPAIGLAKLDFQYSRTVVADNAFTVRCYRSNTYLPTLAGFNNRYTHIDTLEDSITDAVLAPITGTTYTVEFNVDPAALAASGKYSYVFASDREIANTNPGLGKSEYGKIFWQNNTAILKLYTS